MFAKARFLLSASAKKHFPVLQSEDGNPLPEIVFVGKSNVGKSSLLDHLTQNPKLAYVSSKPGKTRLINFFQSDGLILVDLPGYGFAKVSKKMRSEWGKLIEDYFQERTHLKLLLHLIDVRHPPTKGDLAFASWAHHFNKPLLTVFTKADKLRKGALETQCRKNFTLLTEGISDKHSNYISYSIKNGKAREHLIKEIEQRI